MKSIIEEAASVSKAIEKGWEKAGKPEEFTIKVLQFEEKGFLGFTKKAAKVALFFNEKRKPATTEKQVQSVLKKPEQQNRALADKKRGSELPERAKVRQIQPKKSIPTALQKQILPGEDVFWTDDMVKIAKEWLSSTFNLLGYTQASFAVKQSPKVLYLEIQRPAVKNSLQQKHLASSLALLLMQALRNKCKKPLRGLKVVFTIESHE